MPKKPTINAVIEGAFQSDWQSEFYKISNLDIPEGVTKINDGTYSFTLSGNTHNFEKVEEVKYDGDKEIIIGDLASCKGIILDSAAFPPNSWLQRPRAIITRRGEIYIDHSFDIGYHVFYGTNVIPSLVKLSGEVFKSDEWDSFYKKYSSMKKFTIPKKKTSQGGVFKLSEIPKVTEYLQMRKRLMKE